MVESKLRMLQNSTNISGVFQSIKDHIRTGVVVAEVDVQRDFDRMDPLILADALKELGLWDEMARFWEALILQLRIFVMNTKKSFNIFESSLGLTQVLSLSICFDLLK